MTHQGIVSTDAATRWWCVNRHGSQQIGQSVGEIGFFTFNDCWQMIPNFNNNNNNNLYLHLFYYERYILNKFKGNKMEKKIETSLLQFKGV